MFRKIGLSLLITFSLCAITIFTVFAVGESAPLPQKKIPIISGDWEGIASPDNRPQASYKLILFQRGKQVSGQLIPNKGSLGSLTGTLNGNDLTFSLSYSVETCWMSYHGSGALSINQLTLTFSGADCEGEIPNGKATFVRAIQPGVTVDPNTAASLPTQFEQWLVDVEAWKLITLLLGISALIVLGISLRFPIPRHLVLIWFTWASLLIGFQAIIQARFQPSLPDQVLSWTGFETTPASHLNQPYLLEPFMNNQVAWDSEFYLSIATGGYDDPRVRIEPRTNLSLNYAFFPLYPYTIRLFALPLRIFGLDPIATASLAGVLVSALGTLLAMISLYTLAKDELDVQAGARAAFYLIIFPTGFFLAQIYTEGLFVGLAFSSLVLIRKRKWLPAALFSILATWTRAQGVLLVLPFAIRFYQTENLRCWLSNVKSFLANFRWRVAVNGLLALSPVLAYLAWQKSHLGISFNAIEANYFHRGFLEIFQTFLSWTEAIRMMQVGNQQTVVYYGFEFGAIILGLISCLVYLRSAPDLALFGLAVMIVSFTSGPAQGMHRYFIVLPTIFLLLARLGKHPAFDRAWTLASLLLMGLLVTLFTFNMWVA